MNLIGMEQNNYRNYQAADYTAVKKWMAEDTASQSENSLSEGADAGQVTSFGKQNTALMEIFEKMSHHNPQKQEIHTIEDPFGLLRKQEGSPYASFANENGVIEYNGVTFTQKGDCICLGDMSNLNQVVRIPLSAGGSLLVNRSCVGQLARAIGMFSPEDQGRILRALELDAKIQEIKNEIEEMESEAGKETSGGQEDPAGSAESCEQPDAEDMTEDF